MGIRIKRVIALVLSISLLDMQLVYGEINLRLQCMILIALIN